MPLRYRACKLLGNSAGSRGGEGKRPHTAVQRRVLLAILREATPVDYYVPPTSLALS